MRDLDFELKETAFRKAFGEVEVLRFEDLEALPGTDLMHRLCDVFEVPRTGGTLPRIQCRPVRG